MNTLNTQSESNIYIAPLKSEALPTRVSFFTDKQGGFQILAEVIERHRKRYLID